MFTRTHLLRSHDRLGGTVTPFTRNSLNHVTGREKHGGVFSAASKDGFTASLNAPQNEFPTLPVNERSRGNTRYCPGRAPIETLVLPIREALSESARRERKIKYKMIGGCRHTSSVRRHAKRRPRPMQDHTAYNF